jgi:hypothetical protein
MRRWSILVIVSSMAQAFSAALAQDPCRPEDRRLVPTALPGTAGLSCRYGTRTSMLVLRSDCWKALTWLAERASTRPNSQRADWVRLLAHDSRYCS